VILLAAVALAAVLLALAIGLAVAVWWLRPEAAGVAPPEAGGRSR
jgi:hypothetical protein